MSSALLVLAWSLPFALAPLSLRRKSRWLVVLAPLAALAAVGLVPVGQTLALEWLLLGVHLEFDRTGKFFLLFSALLWLFAAFYGALSKHESGFGGRFRLFFLSSMASNFLLILAADMLTFYVGFALMGLAAYGMVVQRRSQRARRAGQRFLAWTLVGEVALFSALMLLFAHGGSLAFADLADTSPPALAVALLILGFGIKLAVPGLHFWLPRTYAVTPVEALAVLSGPMLTAGLLGWLRFLPVSAPGLVAWSEGFVLAGALGVGLGVAGGVVQHDPRVVLGYSSIAKVGLMTAVFGIALGHPAAADPILAALVLFALNHLLVKGALFLGIGEWERDGARPGLLIGLVVLTLALAGAPLTGGAAAKAGLSTALAALPNPLAWLFVVAAFGTALLMMRLIWLLVQADARSAEPYGPAFRSWLVLVVLALWLPFYPNIANFEWKDVIPLVVGLVVGAAAWALVPHGRDWRRRHALGVPRCTSARRPWAWTNAIGERVREKRLAAIIRLGPTCWSTTSLAETGLTWLVLFSLLLSTLLVSG